MRHPGSLSRRVLPHQLFGGRSPDWSVGQFRGVDVPTVADFELLRRRHCGAGRGHATSVATGRAGSRASCTVAVSSGAETL